MKSGPRSFGALVLTHGRAGRVATVASLRRCGYTGPVRLVVDDEDEQVDAYRNEFGTANVIVFDKAAEAARTDCADTANDRRCVVFARNASFGIARRLGWTHFVQLDDDYVDWRWAFDSSRRYAHPTIVSLDRVFAALARFLDATPATSLALAQAGDFIGGRRATILETVNIGRSGVRKAMNSFVCRTDRPFRFVGRVNEDVSTYVTLGSRGALFFSANMARLTQRQTQSSDGGMSGLYRDGGTYRKSFYSVMMAPSCVVVGMLRDRLERVHHRVAWRYAVPKILPARYAKEAKRARS